MTRWIDRFLPFYFHIDLIPFAKNDLVAYISRQLHQKAAVTKKYDKQFLAKTVSRIHSPITSLYSTDTYTSYSWFSKQLKPTASNTNLTANIPTQLDSAKTSRILNNSHSKSLVAFNHPAKQLHNSASVLGPQIHNFKITDGVRVSLEPSPRVTFQLTPTSSIKNLTSSSVGNDDTSELGQSCEVL